MIHHTDFWAPESTTSDDDATDDSDDEGMAPAEILSRSLGVDGGAVRSIRTSAAFIAYASATWFSLIFASPDDIHERFVLCSLPCRDLTPPYTGYVRAAGVKPIHQRFVSGRRHQRGRASDIWFTDGTGVCEMMDHLVENYRSSGEYRSAYINTVRTIAQKAQSDLAVKIVEEYGHEVPLSTFTFFGSEHNYIYIGRSNEESPWYGSKRIVKAALHGLFASDHPVQKVEVIAEDDGRLKIHLAGKRGSVLNTHYYDVLERLYSARGIPMFVVAISGNLGGRGSHWKTSLHKHPLTDMYVCITKSISAEFLYRHFEEILQIMGRICGRDDSKRHRTLWVSHDDWEVLSQATEFVAELNEVCAELDSFTLGEATTAVLRKYPTGSVHATFGDTKHCLTRQKFHKSSTNVVATAFLNAYRELDVLQDAGEAATIGTQTDSVLLALRAMADCAVSANEIVKYLVENDRVRNANSGEPSELNSTQVSSEVLVFNTNLRGRGELKQLNGVITKALWALFKTSQGSLDKVVRNGWEYNKMRVRGEVKFTARILIE